MDYVIKNNKDVYIRINDNGNPVSCAEHEKALFEHSKAKNILGNLPKTLRRLHFKVIAVPDMPQKAKNTEKKVIQTDNYIVPDEISQWVEKFGICDDILKEAQKRKDELKKALSEVD